MTAGAGAAGSSASAPGWTGATGAQTRLLLLRHGQTLMSVDRRYSGRGNPALTELGREQAARAADAIADVFDDSEPPAVLSSPLARARSTADEVGTRLGVPVHLDDGLIETDFGDWEGLTFGQAAARDPERHRRWLSDIDTAPPNGESFAAVTSRVRAALTALIAAHGPGDVVVVTHVTPIKTILRLALDVGPSLLFRLHLDLASISVAEFYPDGGSSVRSVNDTAHLRRPATAR